MCGRGVRPGALLEEAVNYMEEDPFSGFGLKPIDISDQATFNDCFTSLSEPLSDYTFSQLITWGNSLRILWKEIRGHVCVFANGTGDLTLLVPPIGDGGDSHRALVEAFEVMDAYNEAHRAPGRSRVEYVSDELLRRLDSSRLVVTPMGADYVYDVGRMIDLAGGDLASKRQLKNRFLRNYEHRVEAYDRARHEAECRQLLRLWKKQQDRNDADGAQTSAAMKRSKETRACELALEYADALGLKGMVVYVKAQHDAVDGGAGGEDVGREWSIRGFTFGEPLGNDQSSILIEKTDLGVRGLAQFIFSEFCRRDWSHRPLVNAGDDWGLESLAWTKNSYRPVKLLQKHELRLVPSVSVAVPSACPEGTFAAPLTEVAAVNFHHVERHRRVIVEPVPTGPQGDGEGTSAGTSVVRRASRADLPAAALLEQSCFTSHRISPRQLEYLHNRPSAVFVVAEKEGKVVGEGIALVRKNKKAPSGRIYSLAVDGECRRERIGQRLLEAMLEDLTTRGVKRVFLEVEQANDSAIRLYERNGFRVSDQLPAYYGEGRNGVRMVREVDVMTSVIVDPAPA